jgi:hypothetical protein
MLGIMEDNRETGRTILDELTWIEYYGLAKNPHTGFGLFRSEETVEVALVEEVTSLHRVWTWLPAEYEDEPAVPVDFHF